MDIVIKLSKMANQIEMTTAEGLRQNVFHNSFAVFGKTPITTKKTFSFNIRPPKNNNLRSAMNDKKSEGEDVTKNRVDEEGNKTWIPHNTSMALATDRENSFITWPRQIAQKASDFVPSGFYYTGRGDVVQCFFCGIALKHWSRNDSVNLEHRKHSPECKFQLMIRPL